MADETTLEEIDEEVDEATNSDVESDGEGGPAEGSDEWWALFGDEADDLKDKYRGDPAALVQAYRGLRSQSTRMSEELNEFREYAKAREEYDKQQDQGGRQPVQDAPEPSFDYAALTRQGGSFFDSEGELDADKIGGLFQVAETVMRQTIEKAVLAKVINIMGQYDQERVAPLNSQLQEDRDAREIAGLEEIYGDRFDDVTNEALKIREQYPDLSPTALYGMASGVLETRNAKRRGLEAQGFTIGRSGRPAPPKPKLSSDELELAAMDNVRLNKSMI